MATYMVSKTVTVTVDGGASKIWAGELLVGNTPAYTAVNKVVSGEDGIFLWDITAHTAFYTDLSNFAAAERARGASEVEVDALVAAMLLKAP